eukprot:CAMPEP_0172519402 /NCGR_PEP_ID=MMETSP1066-20121228/291394_1 /TAXON_ID=671091 /ORGANISM="Coscinodiscus wailesii, Strain CCMP2513" /LENGTH=363 /DNA_ID=CAMNT_0013301981 /DNA_START=368 /DNA_END=1464 /DNA_ORIENTATION=-
MAWGRWDRNCRIWLCGVVVVSDGCGCRCRHCYPESDEEGLMEFDVRVVAIEDHVDSVDGGGNEGDDPLGIVMNGIDDILKGVLALIVVGSHFVLVIVDGDDGRRVIGTVGDSNNRRHERKHLPPSFVAARYQPPINQLPPMIRVDDTFAATIVATSDFLFLALVQRNSILSRVGKPTQRDRASRHSRLRGGGGARGVIPAVGSELPNMARGVVVVSAGCGCCHRRCYRKSEEEGLTEFDVRVVAIKGHVEGVDGGGNKGDDAFGIVMNGIDDILEGLLARRRRRVPLMWMSSSLFYRESDEEGSTEFNVRVVAIEGHVDGVDGGGNEGDDAVGIVMNGIDDILEGVSARHRRRVPLCCGNRGW